MEAYRLPWSMVLPPSPFEATALGTCILEQLYHPRLEESEVTINSIQAPSQIGCLVPLVPTCSTREVSLSVVIPTLISERAQISKDTHDQKDNTFHTFPLFLKLNYGPETPLNHPPKTHLRPRYHSQNHLILEHYG